MPRMCDSGDTPPFHGIKGEMAQRFREMDWTKTPLGRVETWDRSLCTVVDLMLRSAFPQFVAWGPERTLLYNDAFRPILGTTKHPNALGAPFEQIWQEIWTDLSPIVDAVDRGESTYFEDLPLLVNRCGFDEQTYFTFTYSPVGNDAGKTAGLYCSCIETTTRKLLEDSVIRLHTVVEAMNEGHGFMSRSERLMQISQYQRYFIRRLADALPSIGLIADPSSTVTRFNEPWSRTIALSADESDAYFRNLVDSSPALLWVADEKGQCTYLSKQWYDRTGRTPEQGLGVGWLDDVHPDDRPAVARLFVSGVSARDPLHIDYRLRDKSGGYRWVLDSGNPRFDADGNFLGYVGTIVDVHDRTVAEHQLKALQERYERSTKATDLGVWYTDLPFDLLSWNAEVKRHFFLPPDATVTMDTFYERVHPDDRELARKAIQHSIDNNAPYDIHYRTTNPLDPTEIKWIHAMGWTDYDKNGSAVRFDGFTLDVSAQRRSQEELRLAKEEAERANELKSAFLANMSHEIRTPLGAIMGFADLMRDPQLTVGERSNYLDIMMRNGEQLSVLINEILDLSKVEAGHLALEWVETDPRAIATDVVALLRVKAEEKDLELAFESEESTPTAFVSDPVRARQVLLNLVSNAVKFTRSGKVTVRSHGYERYGKRYCAFEIIDTGIGIASEVQEKIFEVFVQADPSTTRQFGGTGLGLALSRRLARTLGGDVVITASRPGAGSTFLFTFEDLPERRVALQPVKAEPMKLVERRSGQALEGVRVLIVDDAPDNRRLLSLVLSKQGAHVASAENGSDGYKQALAEPVDIVLMDLQMPVMDGYTATQKLREHGFRKPIIALTAHAMSDIRKKCLNMGCTDHLAKPINFKDLVETIKRHVSI